LADFCNAVVIMTSNLGAEAFQQGDFGFVKKVSGTNVAVKRKPYSGCRLRPVCNITI
jgi:ATP-dependent Clp protease ATP-binding subunit ClpA